MIPYAQQPQQQHQRQPKSIRRDPRINRLLCFKICPNLFKPTPLGVGRGWSNEERRKNRKWPALQLDLHAAEPCLGVDLRGLAGVRLHLPTKLGEIGSVCVCVCVLLKFVPIIAVLDRMHVC